VHTPELPFAHHRGAGAVLSTSVVANFSFSPEIVSYMGVTKTGTVTIFPQWADAGRVMTPNCPLKAAFTVRYAGLKFTASKVSRVCQVPTVTRLGLRRRDTASSVVLKTNPW